VEDIRQAQPTLDDLNGSPCTVNGGQGQLQVGTDSSGVVALTCWPEVTVTVSGGGLDIVNFLGAGFACIHLNVTSCSFPVRVGTQVQVLLQSGPVFDNGKSFTYKCGNDPTLYTATLSPANANEYTGQCPQPDGVAATVNSAYAVTVSFSG
jgi:hypothetical protein